MELRQLTVCKPGLWPASLSPLSQLRAPSPSPAAGARGAQGVNYTLLRKDEQLIATIISRWQSWQHGFGAVQLDYNDANPKLVIVHAKYCKAICPNGHYALPNGQQMHGKYEGSKADLMADMRSLRAR